jgi:2-C-methyl-D-erythritol 4-phosphate cytidylyltransferase
MMPRYVIITAAGKGIRMNTPLPKQFLALKGRPVLMHTIEAFTGLSFEIHIILVLPSEQLSYWQQLCREHRFGIPHHVTTGGPARFHSVKNGLKLVPDHAVVGIHDGVRPLVSADIIENAFRQAEKLGNAIPVVGITESVRMTENTFNKPINREQLRIVQTPQCFHASLIKKAYQTPFNESFTDDASVLEKTGARIYLSDGNRHNIKITTPEDLVVAEALLSYEL